MMMNGPGPRSRGPGRALPGHVHWAEDPALWNGIRTEPADATREEGAKQVLGSTTRLYELQAPSPQSVGRSLRARGGLIPPYLAQGVIHA
jgi:hypothetical protein